MSDDHLSESDLAGYLDGDLPTADRDRIRRHLESCDECRAEALAVTRLLATVPKGTESSKRTPAKPRLRGGLAAAAVLAAVVAGVLVLSPESGRIAVQRAESDTSRAEGVLQLATHGPAPGSSVARRELRFVWGSRGAEAYRITITAADGRLLWSQTVSDTIAVPPATLDLPAGQPLYWFIDAIGAGVIARSTPGSFTVVP